MCALALGSQCRSLWEGEEGAKEGWRSGGGPSGEYSGDRGPGGSVGPSQPGPASPLRHHFLSGRKGSAGPRALVFSGSALGPAGGSPPALQAHLPSVCAGNSQTARAGPPAAPALCAFSPGCSPLPCPGAVTVLGSSPWDTTPHGVRSPTAPFCAGSQGLPGVAVAEGGVQIVLSQDPRWGLLSLGQPDVLPCPRVAAGSQPGG